MLSTLSIAVFIFVVGQAGAIPCSTSVDYFIKLDCTWTSTTHPVDYPAGVAHFSPLCGTVHNDDYTLWTLGGTATLGVKDVAELGNCTKLESEIDACVDAGYCANGGFIKFMCQPSGSLRTVCTFAGTVTVTEDFSKVSFMTMLAPSPDWNAGLGAIELCNSGLCMTRLTVCKGIAVDDDGKREWIDRYPKTGTVELLPFDAGTDAGATFMSPNAPLQPHQPIVLFDAENSANIFYNPTEGKLNPICKASIARVV